MELKTLHVALVFAIHLPLLPVHAEVDINSSSQMEVTLDKHCPSPIWFWSRGTVARYFQAELESEDEKLLFQHEALIAQVQKELIVRIRSERPVHCDSDDSIWTDFPAFTIRKRGVVLNLSGKVHACCSAAAENGGSVQLTGTSPKEIVDPLSPGAGFQRFLQDMRLKVRQPLTLDED